MHLRQIPFTAWTGETLIKLNWSILIRFHPLPDFFKRTAKRSALCTFDFVSRKRRFHVRFHRVLVLLNRKVNLKNVSISYCAEKKKSFRNEPILFSFAPSRIFLDNEIWKKLIPRSRFQSWNGTKHIFGVPASGNCPPPFRNPEVFFSLFFAPTIAFFFFFSSGRNSISEQPLGFTISLLWVFEYFF